MDFSIYNAKYFKVGIDYFVRVYRVYLKQNGMLRVSNMMTGALMFENLDPATVTLNGQPFIFDNMQDIIFNRSCLCDESGELPDPFKIFDLSFDETFE